MSKAPPAIIGFIGVSALFGFSIFDSIFSLEDVSAVTHEETTRITKQVTQQTNAADVAIERQRLAAREREAVRRLRVSSLQDRIRGIERSYGDRLQTQAADIGHIDQAIASRRLEIVKAELAIQRIMDQRAERLAGRVTRKEHRCEHRRLNRRACKLQAVLEARMDVVEDRIALLEETASCARDAIPALEREREKVRSQQAAVRQERAEDEDLVALQQALARQ